MPIVQTTDGTDIYYNDWGSGPPVVLIHGWPLDADMWEYQAPVLAAAGYRVIAYDRRGFGRSGQPWSGYDYDTFAGDLNSLMEALDLRDATLVGFSMGGGEVARYLGTHGGSRVAKAVFVSAVTPFMLQTGDNPDGVPQSVFDEMVDGLRQDRPNFLASFGKKFMGAGLLNFSVSSELLQWTSQVAMLASPKATIDCVRAFSTTDFRADLARITVPTLVIHGDGDETVPIDVSGRRTAAMIPGATLLEYPGAAHGLFYTEKERLNTDLLAFLRG
ncbi:alpha/beta fold hydrolase [Plastoroseomonas arctica]|uniref:Alpha/beta hydrolase n=1 Tax=Plastoroseomonas arctica TaxID=1509237 RepID=A0AAF1K8N3_9PROT|nr:alpha/beta hydrolase [Plastoroseomonas arctica]MBR0657456.1 alpha/beta hydrolase [Plastoroseomonas arctica]